MLAGIVLAAGSSRRMGKIKALLKIKGKSFIEKIIGSMRQAGCDEIIAVLGAEHDVIEKQANLKGVKIVVNEKPDSEQLDSLRMGIAALPPQCEAFLLIPVDHPLIEQSTFLALTSAWEKNRERIAVPIFKGRKGHPVIFPQRVFEKLMNDDLPDGARGMMRKESESVLFIPVDDPGVVFDIDTPEDYNRLTGEA